MRKMELIDAIAVVLAVQHEGHKPVYQHLYNLMDTVDEARDVIASHGIRILNENETVIR